jgi:hypothetical protein
LFAISSISSKKPIRRSLLSSKPLHVKAAMVLVVVEDTVVVAVEDEAGPLETGITERPLAVVMVVAEEEDMAVVAEDMVTAVVAAPATAVEDTVVAEEEEEDTAVVVMEDLIPLPNTAAVGEEEEEAVSLPPAGGRLCPPLDSFLVEPPRNGGYLA